MRALSAVADIEAIDDDDDVGARLGIDDERERDGMSSKSSSSSSASSTEGRNRLDEAALEDIAALSLRFLTAPFVFVLVCLPLPRAGTVLVGRLSAS